MNERATHSIENVMTIGVPVSDQDRALTFYRDRLGFRLHWPGVPAMFAFRDQDGNSHEIVEVS
jgi:catechol 2,3-dioxygenase-like lactoylglutathione lyase family enzyme